MTFDDYLRSIAPLTAVAIQPDAVEEHAVIREAADALVALDASERSVLAELVRTHPRWVPILGLVVGLSQERLKNVLRHHFDTSGWINLARDRSEDLIGMLDAQYALVAKLEAQRKQTYGFADVLVARAGSRASAGAAVRRGRGVEDLIEAGANGLGLACEVRTRFTGRNGETGPCDLAKPAGGEAAQIVCAAKGFDSTGSKLSDAVREIVEMAEFRLPTQFVFAVVDGIGWKSRRADLRRIHELWSAKRIDGLYTVAMLDRFIADLDGAARRLDLPRATKS
jgi:hypothetical protein